MANRTYEYNPTGGSPVINVTAGAELKTAVAVLLTKDGAKLPEAGKKATGIVLLGDETASKGDDITVQIRNQGMWTAGAAFDSGDFLAVDPEGNNRAVHLSYGTDTSDSKRRHRKRCDHPCWI